MHANEAELVTVAPGLWRADGLGGGAERVHFELPIDAGAGADSGAVRRQLVHWLDALRQANVDGVLVPALAEDLVDSMRLTYPRPVHVGRTGFPAVPTMPQVIDALRDVARILDRLHAAGIVHGGLGLPSLWWMRGGAIALPDVALAHALDGLVPVPAVAAEYRAPESWRHGEVLPASDQYALAVIAFELLTGRARRTVERVEGLVAFEPLVVDPTQRLAAGVPPGVSAVLARALSTSPAARFPNCSAFVDALSGEAVTMRSLPTLHNTLGGRRRYFTPKGIGTLVTGIALLAAALFALWRPESPQRVVRTVTGRLPTGSAAQVVMPGSGSGDLLGGLRGSAPTSRSATPTQDSTFDRLAPAVRRAGRVEASPAGSPAAPAPAANIAEGAGASLRRRDGAPASTADAVVPEASPDAGSVRGGAVADRRGATEAPTTTAPSTNAPGAIRLVLPTGARAYVDGVLVTDPRQPVRVAPGSHDVDVVHAGVAGTRRQRVSVPAGDTLTVRVRRP